jgi:serine/threonine-protein kinase
MSDDLLCPTDGTWKAWLETGGDLAVREDDLLSHLDRCEQCQHSVATLSADDLFYCQSREALRWTGLSSHDWQPDGADPIGFPDVQDQSPALVSLVQSLVSPTDDEGSIGRLGRFEILGIIGSGGMGIVLKARSIDMDRVVAIKIPQPQYWQAHDTLLTLEREARSAAAVVHPNVISIYHVDRYRDVPYLVMPYLAGQSLEKRIQETGPMPIAETLRIGRQVASALAAAHACGVVHRDVKPANILLGAGTERVVLSDFGLAKVQTDATCTATGTFAGTPIYLSPEQASGCGAGPAGDLYSLGTVLWTMLCGRPPMSGMHTHAIVRKIVDGDLPKLSEHRPDLPPWLVRLVGKLHSNAPVDRPSAETLTGWIQACQRHTADTRSAAIPQELCVDEAKPKRRFIQLTVAALMILAAVLGWLFFDPSGQPARSQPFESTAQTESPPRSKPSLPPDGTEVLLDQIQTELDELNQATLPRWDSAVQRMLEDAPSLDNAGF